MAKFGEKWDNRTRSGAISSSSKEALSFTQKYALDTHKFISHEHRGLALNRQLWRTWPEGEKNIEKIKRQVGHWSKWTQEVGTQTSGWPLNKQQNKNWREMNGMQNLQSVTVLELSTYVFFSKRKLPKRRRESAQPSVNPKFCHWNITHLLLQTIKNDQTAPNQRMIWSGHPGLTNIKGG